MSPAPPSRFDKGLEERGFATLIVVAKSPRPGWVKTRLSPHYSPRQAADLAIAALADTLDVVARAPARRRLLVLDGDDFRWRRPGLEIVAQSGGGLDERLAHAFSLVRPGTGACLLVGMDTPQVTTRLLTMQNSAADAWFGPTEDGGFWALGFAEPPDPAWLLGVPMSRADTGAEQRRRLTEAGLAVVDLPTLRDVDTAHDVPLVAEQARNSRFALLAEGLAAA